MRNFVQNNKASSMVEAGILSAISVVFAMISLYIPVFGVVFNVLWPVPLILLGVRHGLKWSIMSLATATVIIAIVVSPVQAILQTAGLGLIGLTIGFCLHRDDTALTTVFYGAVASFISKIIVLGITVLIMGVNPLDFDADAVSRITNEVLDYYRKFGTPEAELEQIRAMTEMMLGMMKKILPAGFILGSFFDTWLNFLAAKAILKRLGTYVKEMPLFREIIIPDIFLLLFGGSYFMAYFFKDDTTSLYNTIATNFYVLASIPMILQGFAIIWFWVHKRNLPNLIKGFSLALFFISPIAAYIVTFAGVLDYIFNFRKIRPIKK